jgi:histidine triad (HIT) family protein
MAYDTSNIFAKILRGEASAHRLWEDEHTLAILDVMPQSEGHSLVLPKWAAENLFEVDEIYGAAVMRTSRRVAEALMKTFRADGITLMQFNGAAAGQTVFHFHMHVIPRYAGQSLRSHGRGFAPPDQLAEQAERIRRALGQG